MLPILILYWMVGRCFGAGKERAGRDKELPILPGLFVGCLIRSPTLDWPLCIVRQAKEEKYEDDGGGQLGGGEIVKDVEVKWRVSRHIIVDPLRSLWTSHREMRL